MLNQWLFWGVALALIMGSLLAVFAPLLRGRARSARRASYDIQVYRDQLREIEAERARGVLSDDEAEATRTEVSRRLLAAADAEAAETAAGLAPRRVSAAVAVALLVVLVAVTSWLYAALGVPGLPDQPLEARLARLAQARAERPSQAEVEAMIAESAPAAAPEDGGPAPDAGAAEDSSDTIEQEDVPGLVARLEAALATRPDDLAGHQLLARSLAGLGRWADAGRAQGRVVTLLGETADADDFVTWAEYMILAARGYVSPEAEAALARAIAIEPSNPIGLYYTGRTLAQGGRPDLAYRVWSALLDRGPPDAPWVAAVEAEIDVVAQMAGLPRRGAPQRGPVRTEVADLPGMAGMAGMPGMGGMAGMGGMGGMDGMGGMPMPSDSDVAAARDMTPQDRQAMIEGMVGRLADRLAREGGPAEDWARLIRSLGVLGRREEASAIFQEARGVFAQEPAGRSLLEAAAREAGLGE